ncbi:hypothetical protein HY621_02330 [Candidatus Uhrbacteria bacterium]|nr:hypothetical protein [Candidatus Uhrbacteria bacterium]
MNVKKSFFMPISVRLIIFSVVFFLTVLGGVVVFGLSDNSNDRFFGRILLEVEKKGEAWYVNPHTGNRAYLGRPDDAFSLMRSMGIGIATKDLNRIPIENSNLDQGGDSDSDALSDDVERAFGTDPQNSDTDGDGYVDGVEVRNGYSPVGAGKFPADIGFTKKQAGKILLQVEQNGEAWYVHPKELKRYYLGRPAYAFDVMRKTGLGISNVDIATIPQILPVIPPSVPALPVFTPDIPEQVVLPVPSSDNANKTPNTQQQQTFEEKPVKTVEPAPQATTSVPSQTQATSTPPIVQPSLPPLAAGQIEAPIIRPSDNVSSESASSSTPEKILETPDGIGYTLGYNGPHTMYLPWSTQPPSMSWLSYGKTKSVSQEYKIDGYRKEHKTLVKGLEPNTKYYLLYRSQVSSGEYGVQRGVSTQTTGTSSPDYIETGETATAQGQETGGLALKIHFPLYQPEDATENKMAIDLSATPTFTLIRITAYAKQIRVEWDKTPNPSVRTLSGTSYTAIKSDVRVDYGPDERFGFWDATYAAKDFPETERTATSMLLKDFDPDHTYYLQLKLIFGDSLITRTIAVKTSQEGAVPNVYEVKNISMPRVTEFLYPIKASTGLLQVKTNTPSNLTVEYGKADTTAWRYTDRVSSASLSSVHTFTLKNLEAGHFYHIKLKIQNTAGDYYVYEFARKIL